MLRVFIAACVFLLPVRPLTAQDGPPRSITGLNSLLQKSIADSERVNLLLESALLYVLKTGMEKNDFDSALVFINQAMILSKTLKDPAWQARCFIVYSQLYREGNQKEKGKNYIENAITIFTKDDLKEGLADAYIELHHYYNVYSDSAWFTRVKYAELAEGLYMKSGNKFKQASVLKDLGDYYQIREKDSIALEYLHKALAIFQSIRYPKLEGVYDLIGYVLYNMGDYNQALKYELMAVEIAERLATDSVELSTIYNRVGVTHYRLTHYEEAAKYFTKGFFIAVANQDTSAAQIIAQSALNSYLRLGKQGELLDFLRNAKLLSESAYIEDRAVYFSAYSLAWLLTGNHKKAAPYVEQLLQLVGDTNDIELLRSLHRAIIPFYLAAGQYKEMYKYLPVNENICKRTNVISGLVDNYLWWYKADSALGDHTAAMSHYKLYKEASDSLLRFTASKQINELMIQYESTKKDQLINLKEQNIQLLNKQDQFQKSKLQQGGILRNISFAVVALLIIIMALLYNRYRLKQRANRKLELQQNEIAKQNLSLHHLVTEKEWLLKEIHHRVKNNLQIVMSLLNSQSAYIDNEPALTAIHDSQHRVHAISLIHQKLYNSENLSSIEMSVYIRELISYLSDSFDTGQHIRFELNIEPLVMDVSHAVPLGLILNEAITNAIKYAFPDGRKGSICISLGKTVDEHYLLSIADDGIGMPLHLTNKKPGSLGMSLMAGLSEDLDGNFSIENNNGTTINISFVHDISRKRPDLSANSFVTS